MFDVFDDTTTILPPQVILCECRLFVSSTGQTSVQAPSDRWNKLP